ncbi:transposase [Streptomyces sp. NPDC057908]|uniref:transposase n=1 Tax=Streptomyces sp. NPDC057908 TaxID=3346276 RepID=UPI0036F0F4D9
MSSASAYGSPITSGQDSPGLGRHYGVPRITAEPREYGERVNHKKTARAMRQVGLAALRLRRRHRTTVADSATHALRGTVPVAVAAILLWLHS